MEIVTLVIAITGFLMSSATWIRDFIQRGNRFEIEIIDYAEPLNVTQIFLSIRNKSTLPLSIGKITMIDGINLIDCQLEPKLIKKTSSGFTALTPQFPLSIPPQAYGAVYLEFLFHPEIPLRQGKRVSFQIHTSRGVIKKSVCLADTGYYLHTR